MDTTFFTVIGGVLVFVIGQIVLTLIIIPSQELKKSIGGISHSLLLHQAKLTNASFDDQISDEMKLKSAEIVSKTHTVLWYSAVRLVFGLPSKQNILSASKQLNSLSYTMSIDNQNDSRPSRLDYSTDNVQSLKEIGRLLSIQVTYSENK